MLIKYGELDVTNRLLSYKMSIAFAKGYIIGNVPTIQLDLQFDNYDGILDNLDINQYWEVQENENSNTRYFKVYDQPEKYTKSLSLKLYDNNYELDVPYPTKLSYPVTIKDQLDEIETLTGFSIIRTNVPNYILNKEVSWYDNTIVIRNYLGWIAELFGANVYASGKSSLEFIQVTKNVFTKTDTLTNYEKNELYKVSRVYYENGINPLEKGDTTGNTVFLDANNLYLTDDQSIIDKLYDQLNGITFNLAKSINMISIDNLLPGCLVNYNDEFNFMITDLSITYKGGEFSVSDVDGSVATKNEERVIKKITNSTRIRKLQVTQDQEKLRLNIVAKEQENLNQKVGELTISNDQITTRVGEIEEKIDNLDVSQYRAQLLSSGTIINANNRTITLECKVYNGNDDVTAKQQALQFNWIRNGTGYKTGKSIDVGTIDVNVSANFKCIVTIGEKTLDTGYITIVDETDIANLGNSYLDVSGAGSTQYLNNDGTYFPNWTSNPLIITPNVMDGNIVVDLSNCTITYKKIVNGKETALSSDEVVKNGVLTVNKNIMSKTVSSLNYVCYVTYKNTSIKLFKDIVLNIAGSDGATGKGIVSITKEFYLSDSKEEQTGGSWSTVQPTWVKGKYLWTREKVVYSNPSSIEYTTPKVDSSWEAVNDIKDIQYSATAPSDTTRLWFDTTDNLLKYWNGSTWEVSNDFAEDINNMKQQVTTEYTSAINQLKTSINTMVEKLQTSTTDNTSSIEKLTSQFQQNADSISFITSSINEINNTLTGVSTKEEISKRARFQNGILELGASNSPFAVKLSNTELGFYQNGMRIAYLSNQQLNISQAVVMKQINLGIYQIVYDEQYGLLII